MFIGEFEKSRKPAKVHSRHSLVIVGGGLTGVCCAITAARAGADVALIQDRPVLGGNASSEVRLWALGATSHMGNNNRWSREGGVIDEILVENTFRNREGNPVLFDMVLIDKVLSEPNITLYLNTCVYDAEMSGRTVRSVTAFNPQTGTHHTIEGDLFADCSGDGALAYMAGAEYRMGAEDREEYGEKFAPDKTRYGELLGHSILFYIKDTGRPVRFEAPEFALKEVEELIPRLRNPEYFSTSQHGCKYWWLEYGGRLDTIRDTEKIKFELWKIVYGVWNHIKNSGKYPEMENYTLEWVGLFPGKRESRRFKGYYMLTQQDIIEQHEHYDAVSFGGWSIDLHPADGVYGAGRACNQWHSKGIYQIPYRCLVTPDADNLFIGGRIISVSHVANGSTRVMCTAAHGGQAIGTAAAIALRDHLKPADLIGRERIGQLQSALLRTGHVLPGERFGRGMLPPNARISASSEFALERLRPDGTRFRLDCSAAELIPVDGPVPAVGLTVQADKATRLTVELRSSSRRGNYTPDTTDKRLVFDLREGENRLTVDFGMRYEAPQYVFICFMANPDVSIPMSSEIVSGLTSVFNTVNPAVSNFGRQTPPEDIGVDAFEFWCPKRRPEGKNIALEFSAPLTCFGAENLLNGYFRPYIQPNGWIPAPDDRTPSVRIDLGEERTVRQIRLFFDTDFDHALENVQMEHFDSVMPQCIRNYRITDGDGNLLFRTEGNHQSCNTIALDAPHTLRSIRFWPEDSEPGRHKALMGIIVE